MQTAIGLFFGLTGFAMLFFSIRGFAKKKYAFQGARPVIGQVVDNKYIKLNKGISYYPIYEYQINNEIHKWQSSIATNPPRKIGSKIKLQVNKEGDVTFNTFFSKYFASLGLLILGLICSILGTGVFIASLS